MGTNGKLNKWAVATIAMSVVTVLSIGWGGISAASKTRAEVRLEVEREIVKTARSVESEKYDTLKRRQDAGELLLGEVTRTDIPAMSRELGNVATRLTAVETGMANILQYIQARGER